VNIITILEKDFLLIKKSKILFIFFLVIMAISYMYKIVENVSVKIQIVAQKDIKQSFENYLSNYKNFIITDVNPDFIVNIDSQDNYWIVDIEVVSPVYLRFLPLFNLVIYKTFFSYNNLVDPVKVSINVSGKDYTSYSFLNLVVWFLLSFVGSNLNNEKLKKTALIFPSINEIILSKVISTSFIFFVFLFVYHFIMGINYSYLYIFQFLVVFFLLSYFYCLLFWFISNQYFLSFVNLFVGLFFIFSPFLLGSAFTFVPKNIGLSTFLLTFLLVFLIIFVLSVLLEINNNYLKRIVLFS